MMILPFKLSNVNINHINMINIMNRQSNSFERSVPIWEFL